MNRTSIVAACALLALYLPLPCWSQVHSGSDGHDGAFNPTTNTVINMADHPDGIYHYTEVNIPSDVTVTFIPNAANTPVVWLVQSNCVIHGAVDVSGQSTTNGVGGSGGPGGYSGGDGGTLVTHGRGPGGGLMWSGAGLCAGNINGGCGSFGTIGEDYWYCTDLAGAMYGNIFLVPLVGGSGGGGVVGQGIAGGGGGGAILIAASAQITLNGRINAAGGEGSEAFGRWVAPYADRQRDLHGGMGSGGAVRLVATKLSGAGQVDCSGSPRFAGWGGDGRVRLDTPDNRFAGTITGAYSQGFQPIIIPASGQGAQLTVASIGGVPVPASPSGGFSTPDAVLAAQQANPVPIIVRCSNLPLNTPVTVSVKPANGSTVSAVGYNNTGTVSNSTATVLMNMPRGGGIIYATAATSN
jgi:hypothetical protein